jgi:hypothetical protein
VIGWQQALHWANVKESTVDKLTTPLGKNRNPRATVIKVVEIVGKVGLSAVPIPPLVSEVAKLGLDKIFSYVRQRDEQRILEFYRAFLYRDELPSEDILNAEIEESNFHALLNACVSDIEEEKTVPYANLTRSIALGLVEPELRRHFILSLKDLSWEELDLLRRIYVVTKHPVIPKRGTDFDLTHLLQYSPSQISKTLAVTSLKTKGMLEDDKISFAGTSFITACSNRDDLDPTFYDYRVWSDYRCLILQLVGSKIDNSLSEILASSLRSSRINSYTAMIGGDYTGRRDDAFSRLRYNCCVILLGTEHEIGPKLQEVISEISAHCPVVQAINSEDVVETPLLQMPAVHIGQPSIDSWQIRTVKLLIHEINQSANVRNIPGVSA